MLRYLYADELHRFPTLAEGMFKDRADQFKTRLGWDVHVNEQGKSGMSMTHSTRFMSSGKSQTAVMAGRCGCCPQRVG